MFFVLECCNTKLDTRVMVAEYKMPQLVASAVRLGKMDGGVSTQIAQDS